MKNIVTGCPVAAAPLASTKVTSALSKSSLNIISVLPLASCSSGIVDAPDEPFSMMTVYFPFSSELLMSRLPVVSHHACASRENPASVATISILSPSVIESIACLIFITGPGHCNPHASILKVFMRLLPSRVSVSIRLSIAVAAVRVTIGSIAVE